MACSHLSPGFPTVTNCALSIWSGHPRGEPGLVQRLVGPWLFQIIKMIDMGGAQHGTTHSPHRGQVMSFLRRHIGEWTFASWRSCLTHMIPAQCCSMIWGWVKTYNTPFLGWTSMKPSYFSSCIITVTVSHNRWLCRTTSWHVLDVHTNVVWCASVLLSHIVSYSYVTN